MTRTDRFRLKVLADIVVLAIQIGLQDKREGVILVNSDLAFREVT